LTRTALLALLLAAARANACEPALKGDGVRKAEGKEYVVAWRADPPVLRVSEFFAVDIAACSKSRAQVPTHVRVDAVMPEHKHGMNYRPTVTAVGDGRFRAEGLLLHMPGLWEIKFDLRRAGASEVVSERFSLN
jgi:hypothetical protein